MASNKLLIVASQTNLYLFTKQYYVSEFHTEDIYLHTKIDDCLCVLPDLTWLPLLGVRRKSWYNIIKLIVRHTKRHENGCLHNNKQNSLCAWFKWNFKNELCIFIIYVCFITSFILPMGTKETFLNKNFQRHIRSRAVNMYCRDLGCQTINHCIC